MLATFSSGINYCSYKEMSLNIKTIILHALSYAFENWSFRVSEEHNLRVSENMALKELFQLKRGENERWLE
jgi:hypothetical protein